MITAEEAFRIANESRASSKEHQDKINKIESFIKDAAKNGQCEVHLSSLYLNQEIVEHLEKHRFSVSGDMRDQYMTISWKRESEETEKETPEVKAARRRERLEELQKAFREDLELFRRMIRRVKW